MSYPTYYISSSVTNVDTTTTSKIVMLPTAGTIQGASLYIKDIGGNAATNNIWISTQQFDLIDNYASTITLTTNYQSFKVVPYSTTRYAITQNYTNGLSPFLYAIQLIYEFLSIPLAQQWSALAVSPDGTLMLAVATDSVGGGFYVSVDSGLSFPRYTNYAGGSFVRCAFGFQTMYILSPTGALFRSFDNGVSWDAVGLPGAVYSWVSMSVYEEGGRYSDDIVVIGNNVIYWSTNSGGSYTDASFPVGPGTSFTGCALAANIVYISAQDIAMGGDSIYVCTNLSGGGSFIAQGPTYNWTSVCCSQSGTIAYALTSGGDLYKSVDTGSTWTLIPLTVTLQPYVNILACSSDGQTLFGIDSTGQRYLTKDGATSFSAVGGILASVLNQYGLTANGRESLFAVPGVALNVGRTRIA